MWILRRAHSAVSDPGSRSRLRGKGCRGTIPRRHTQYVIMPSTTDTDGRRESSMVRIKDMPLALRLYLRAYRWRKIDNLEPAHRTKPLDESNVALVSSAGMVVPGDIPFEKNVKGGDWSWRAIPSDCEVQKLEEHHNSDAFDHTGIATDANMGIPIDRLNELAEEGFISSASPRHISVMGSITAPGRFIRKTIPEVVGALEEDQVDVALMVPV